MKDLNIEELYNIDGGKLESLSDWLLLGSSVCFAFCCPPIGIAAAVTVALW